jgi:hypothetical protein
VLNKKNESVFFRREQITIPLSTNISSYFSRLHDLQIILSCMFPDLLILVSSIEELVMGEITNWGVL